MQNDLLKITAHMPCKIIPVDGQNYLARYYAGTRPDGTDAIVHRFLSADGDRHLHNHPWQGTSYILNGGYGVVELDRAGAVQHRVRRPSQFMDIVMAVGLMRGSIVEHPSTMEDFEAEAITPFTWHRVAEIEPHTWSLMIIEPERLPHWYFRDEQGDVVQVEASPRDWWRDYGPLDPDMQQSL
jgi:hypothetical protein